MKTSVDKADVTEDGTEMFGLELMVLCAETALQVILLYRLILSL